MYRWVGYGYTKSYTLHSPSFLRVRTRKVNFYQCIVESESGAGGDFFFFLFPLTRHIMGKRTTRVASVCIVDIYKTHRARESLMFFFFLFFIVHLIDGYNLSTLRYIILFFECLKRKKKFYFIVLSFTIAVWLTLCLFSISYKWLACIIYKVYT